MRKLSLTPRRALMLALASLSCLCAGGAWANTPVGQWHTVDDKSLVVIEEQGGVLRGRVTQLLRKGADPAARCDKCSDDRKGQTILGMEIIRGVKKSAGNDYWDGGEILDPEEGKLYRVRLTPQEGGAKLQVRGFLGPFWRNQLWVKAP